MKRIYLIIFLMLGLFSCKDSDNVVESSNYTNLVILTDFNIGSDFAMTVLGGYKSNFSDLQIDYIESKQFDIAEAGYLLDVAAQDYPDGSYFIVVVEPGADTKKMCFKVGNSKFIVPDNGLATRVLNRYNVSEIYYVDNPNVIGGKVWNEIPFAEFYKEAGISLLNNVALSQMGTKCTNPVKISIQDPVQENDTIKGEVLFTDNFGNGISNITTDLKSYFTMGDIVKINAGGKVFYSKFGLNYASVNVGENVCFFNSSKRLEISINYGNISEKYGLAAGTKLTITKVIPKIGILRYNESEGSQNLINGFKQQLASLGLTSDKVQYIELNAYGDVEKLPALAVELENKGVDIIVPISTPPSQAVVNYVSETIPVVFTYVSAPEYSGITGKRANVTGLSDAQNFNDYLRFAKALFPQLTRAGRIYNQSESNSLYAQEQFVKYASLYNLTFNVETISKESEISAAYNTLKAQGITTFLISSDNTILNGMKILANAAIEDKIFVIAGTKEEVIDGALAAISVNYESLALETGNYIYSVLLGYDPDSKPIKRFSSEYITINKATAGKIGYIFPDSIAEIAKYVIE